MRRKNQGASETILVLLVLLLMLIGPLALASSDHGTPDLVVKELEIEPTQDGFKVRIGIGNIGDGSAGPTNALVMDKLLGAGSEPELISKVTLGDLRSGGIYEKEIDWIPSEAGTHLVYMALDAGRAVRERTELNNIRKVEVSLPVLEEVSSSFDGIVDPEILGTFISDIENQVRLRIRYTGASMPSFLRTYVRVDGGQRTYATNMDDGSLTAEIEMKNLGPGDHFLSVNTTYCGVELPSRNIVLRSASMPPWTSGMSSMETSFDEELNCYYISGRLDIPGLNYRPRLGSSTPGKDLKIGGTEGELLVRSFILADGTTTFRSSLDLSVMAGEQRYTVSSSGTAFSPDPRGPFKLSSTSTEHVEMDLRTFVMGRGIEVEGPYGDPISLPFLPAVNGTISTELELELPANSSHMLMSLDAGIDLHGEGKSLHSVHLPASDDPVTLTCYDIDWSTDHTCSEGAWTSSGDIETRYNASFSDLGLSVGEGPSGPLYDGGGSDISGAPDGEMATVMISPKVGSISKILYEKGDQEVEVYSNNTYMSSPELAFEPDGTALVVWSEASYAEEITARASSLRLKYGTLPPNGEDTFRVDRMFNTSSMDHEPDIGSSPTTGVTAAVWTRDLDSNPRTLADREVAVSILGSGGWSRPELLTDDSLWDSDPCIGFSVSGEPWVVWRTGNSSIRYSIKEEGGQWRAPSEIQLPSGVRLMDISMGTGENEMPLLSYCFMDESGRSYLCSRSANPSRDSNWDGNRTVVETDDLLEEVQTHTSPQGRTTYVWRQKGPDRSDLWATVHDTSGGTSSRPITLTRDEKLEKGTKHYPMGDGVYLFSFSSIRTPDNIGGYVDHGQFHMLNTSWGAAIERTSTDPDIGYSPGSILKLTISLEYMGLSAPGSTRVDVYRRYLDRSSSEVKEEFWASSMKDFDSIADRRRIEFTVSVKEYQLGLSIYSIVPQGVGPEYVSASYISLPSIPDPEISGLEAVASGEQVRFEVEVHNWGNVPVGGWELRLMGKNGSSPMLLPGKVFEPLFIRDRGSGSILNSTEVDLSAGSTATFRMNLTPRSSIEHVWAELISGGWQPDVQSYDDVTLFGTCGVEVGTAEGWTSCSIGESPQVETTLSLKTGCWNESQAAGMRHSVRTQFRDISGNVVWQNHTILNLTGGPRSLVLGPNASLFEPGHYVVRTTVTTSLQDPRRGIETFYGTSHCIVRPLTDLRITEMVKDDNGSVKGIRVTVNNSSPHDIDVLHLTLYNGRPEDQVILSENIALSLKGEDELKVLLPEDLQEGTYLLSAVVRVPDLDREGDLPVWTEADRRVSEMEIPSTEEQTDEQEEELDWGEVYTSLIFSVSAVMVVILLSSVFYSKERRKED